MQRDAELAAERLAAQEREATLGRAQRQLSEQQERNARNEARLVRAFRKLKGEEAVRARVLKALGIATQLLSDAARSSQTAPPRTATGGATPGPGTRNTTGSLTPVASVAPTPPPADSGDGDE